MACMPGPESSVDTALNQSVSFAPPHQMWPATRPDRWTPVAVGPGRPAAGNVSHGVPGNGMTGYPIQPAKVQVPLLRDETLARHRLLDWLAAKVHHRVILVLADAGYGKTTLLAHFSRRARARTLWYRLDEDDRDWISFLSHLVAAGRVHDPGFAPNTASLLGDLALGAPSREAATEVFIRELSAIAAHGALLILDDFHLVDESPDIRQIVREIVAAAPERLAIVFASRRVPAVPLARLRAAGEVAELGTDDLRFDATETARLFTETYGRALDADVLADVATKTEGWAASLQLVQAALRDRTPAQIRQFVRGLSGADQELYDYLAEEVVGDLREDLQQFLMRTSILQAVTPDMACVVADLEEDAVLAMTSAAERLTLLSRPSRLTKGSQRYHPLVREFLEARLRATIGPVGVATLHRRAALAAARDWRVAAYHFREAGEFGSVATTIAGAIPEIMGAGQHAAAIEEIDRVPEASRPPVLDLVVSRIKLQRRDYSSAIELSRAVLETVEPGSQESDFALLNLITLYMQSGFADHSTTAAGMLAVSTSNHQLREIAQAAGLMLDASATGSIEALTTHLVAMADHQRGMYPHYLGVTMLNLAINYLLTDQPDLALAAAEESIEALSETSSRIEHAAALMARANPLTLLGREAEARDAVEKAVSVDEMEVAFERADLADSFTEPDSAWPMIDWLGERSGLGARAMSDLQRAWFFARRGRYVEADEAAAAVKTMEQAVIPGMTSYVQLTLAYVAVASGAPDASKLSQVAYETARTQGATRWQRIADLLRSSLDSSESFGAAISRIGARSPWNITYIADLVAPRLDELAGPCLSVVESAVSLHPGRWRFVLRQALSEASSGEGLTAARLLEQIGDQSDVARLRAFSRR